MEITAEQFEKQCLKFIEDVHAKNTEIVITKQGKPWAKLVSAGGEELNPFLGSYVNVGATVGDLIEPFENEWECD